MTRRCVDSWRCARLTGAVALGLGVSACLGEAEDPPDAGAGDPADGGQSVGSEGGGSGGGSGGSAGSSGGTTPPAAFPSANPDCAPEAVVITAELTATGPFTRSQPAPIRYRVLGKGKMEILGRSQDGGNFTAPGEGRLTWAAGGGEDDPLGANVPIWQGPYHIELAAQDTHGCVGTTRLEVPMVGDVVVGDSNGQLSVRGSDGRWVVALGAVAEQGISALILAPDAPRQFIAGLRSGIGGAPFVARIDERGAILSRFSEVDLQGEPLFASGGPRHLFHDAPRGEVLCDGVPNGAVLRFNLLGDYLGAYEVPVGDSGDHVAVGFSRQEGAILVGTSADDRVYRLGEHAELFVDTGGSFNRLWAVAAGADDRVLVAHTFTDYSNQITAYGPGGQELQMGDLGDLTPEHIVPFRDGYLLLGALDPVRRLSSDLTVLEPTVDGDRWDDYGGFGFGSTGSIVWLNSSAAP